MSGIDFDKVLEMIGDKGRYQTIMFFILCIPATLPVAFLAFSNVFTSATPDHWCKAPPQYRNMNLSEDDLKFLTTPYRLRRDGEKIYSQCTMYDLNNTDLLDSIFTIDTSLSEVFNNDSNLHDLDGIYSSDHLMQSEGKFEASSSSIQYGDKFTFNDDWRRQLEERITNGSLQTTSCQYGWTYDKTYYDSTLVTELDLVCDDSGWPQSSTSFFYFGSLFGNVLFGWVADRFGRRKAMLWMIVLEVFISIATCFSRNYKIYLFLRTLGGFFFPSLYQIPFVLGIEMMGPSHRTFAGMLICSFFAGAMSILALLAYLLRDWFYLSIATSVPFLLLFSYYWIIPESPRWLVSRGRLDDAEEVIQKIAKYNGVTIPKRLLHKLQEESESRSPLIPMIDIRKSALTNMNGYVAKPTTTVHPSHIDDLSKQPVTSENTTHSTESVYSINTQAMKKGMLVRNNEEKCTTENTILNKESVFNSEDNKRDESRHINKTYKDLTGDQDDDRSDCELALSKNVPTVSSCIDVEKNNKLLAPATLVDIFRYPNIRKKFLLLTFQWIVNAVVYNGLSYNATNMGVNDFLAFFIAAVIEIPSNLLAWKLMNILGRRLVLCFSFGAGGLGCICCMFVPEEQVWLTVTFAMIGKFGVAASFTVFYVFVGELFPTVLRSQAMGLSSVVVSVGLLAFPYILQLSQYWRVLPLIVLGILSLAGSVASIFLPETLNTPMPQTLEDGENFGKDLKVLSICRRKPATKM